MPWHRFVERTVGRPRQPLDTETGVRPLVGSEPPRIHALDWSQRMATTAISATGMSMPIFVFLAGGKGRG